MSDHNSASRWNKGKIRRAAKRAARMAPPIGLIRQMESRGLGSHARGEQILNGKYLVSGRFVEAPGKSIWALGDDDPAFNAELHSFNWLADLAAVGTREARSRGQDWMRAWIERFGNGSGPGWMPQRTTSRITAWLDHSGFLIDNQQVETREAFLTSLARQCVFLDSTWHILQGLPRIDALAALIYMGISLKDMGAKLPPAAEALAMECDRLIDEAGGIQSRNPLELLGIFSRITHAVNDMQLANIHPPAAITEAIARIAPVLRALRHSDGGLARFHGGGRGAERQLDLALANSRIKPAVNNGLAMGFCCLAAGRTSLAIDAAPPPAGPGSVNAHASTLAFELTSGRRPVIVNCGSGIPFGPHWRRAARATASHATLGLKGVSSSRMDNRGAQPGRLTETPGDMFTEIVQTPDGQIFEGRHDGYRLTHGLTHQRRIGLMQGGRGISAEDRLLIWSNADKGIFNRALADSGDGIGFEIRFHLHPDVRAEFDTEGRAVALTLLSGECWWFQFSGKAQITVDASVYLEKNRLKPRATKQIVLTGQVLGYDTCVTWSLAKAQDTPDAVRDVNEDELLPPVAEPK